MSADGQLEGPLALVERTEVGLEVQALGVYRGSAERVDLRVHRVGGIYVVVIESSHGDDRVADLVVQSGGALTVAGISDADHACEPARIVVRQSVDSTPSRGWVLHSVRTATLDSDGDALVVTEHIAVRELAAANRDAPARATHDVDGTRRLCPTGPVLRADRPALHPPR